MFSSKPFILPDTFLGNLVPVSILVVIGIVWTSLDNKSKVSNGLSTINSFTFTPNIGNGILAV